jgi:ATP-dependent protease Clp ATPase subunit
MIKESLTLNVARPTLVLELGNILIKRAEAAKTPSRTSSFDLSPETWDEMVAKIAKAVRMDALAERMIGLHEKTSTTQQRLRVSAVACVAWLTLRRGGHKICIGDLAAIIADPMLTPAEGIILARHEIGLLIQMAIFLGSTATDSLGFSHVSLPGNTLTWLSGGNNSLGFLTSAIAANRGIGGNKTIGGLATPADGLSARQLYEATRMVVVGCDDALQILASRISLAKIRMDMLARGKEDTGVGVQVILLFGKSGSGKTLAVRELAKRCHIGFSSWDASCISGETWAGGKVEDAMKQLVLDAGGDIKKAGRSLVNYDEADKLLAKSDSLEHLRSAQASLLRPLGGEKICIGGKRSQDGPAFTFDCNSLCFVFSGVFAGLDEIAKKGSDRQIIGFGHNHGDRRLTDYRRAMVSMGCLDELANRISCFVRLPDPTASSIATAITSSNGILKAFNCILASREIELLPTDSGVRLLSNYGVETSTYYRGVKHIVGGIVEDILFNASKGEKVCLDPVLVQRAIDRSCGLSGAVRDNAEQPENAVDDCGMAREDNTDRMDECEAVGICG